MPQYQLTAAVALAAGLVASLAAWSLAPGKKATTAFPIPEDGATSLLSDPFDVTKPEDFIDGIPVDETRFWTKMRLRKRASSVVLVLILVIQSICLGWSIIQIDRQSMAAYALHVIFALYASVLSVRAIGQTGSKHAHSVIHLSALTGLATALYTNSAILPSSPLPVASRSLAADVTILALWYTVHALYFCALAINVTIPRGPKLHFPADDIYFVNGSSRVTSKNENNVSGVTSDSVLGIILFSYMTSVVMLGKTVESLDIGDLPILAADMRATVLYARMRAATRRWGSRIGVSSPKPGSGVELAYRLLRVNASSLTTIVVIAVIASGLFYVPAFFIQRVIHYLEVDATREAKEWGVLYAVGIFVSDAAVHLLTAHLWTLSTTTLQVRFRAQLNSILFAKTLVRKDIASLTGDDDDTGNAAKDAVEFSSKAQIMTLMTTDVDRIAGFAQHLFSVIDAPLEIAIATWFLYYLLGSSCFVGLAVIIAFLPLNHFAGTVVLGTQKKLMKARDERVSLMNEILGGIRMIKYMAWERSFERRVHEIRARELKYQKKNYTIEVLFNAIWNGSPILVTLATFWHFTVIRQQTLTPSIAFTSIGVFNEMKYAMNVIPETLISLFQSAVSLRRIETYLLGAEVAPVAPLDGRPHPISLRSATVTWAQNGSIVKDARTQPSATSTLNYQFILKNLTLEFPQGELSLICGKLGSGKTLLLLALLGEADVLSGEVFCSRTPPNTLASLASSVAPEEEWIVQGAGAYVPQSAWLRNASIKDNILFNLPYVEERYHKTLEACALLSDLEILEDGDDSEIGEQGVNLSGGQKARVSLARAMYSRASTLFLDDVLSAVDAHTAHHLYYQCLKGDLMHGRTVILVSHHIQLCAAGAQYIVSLDNGQLQYSGDYDSFQRSQVYQTLVQLGVPDGAEKKEDAPHKPEVENLAEVAIEDSVMFQSAAPSSGAPSETSPGGNGTMPVKKPPRKVVEDEKRAVGHIDKDIWTTYLKACGGYGFWFTYVVALGLAAVTPILENGWLRIWTSAYRDAEPSHSSTFYIVFYAAICAFGLVITTSRWFVVYHGGIHASMELYTRLLESVLFANIRFHDTSSRGRLLNRFGKDFEGVDSNLPNSFARSIIHGLGVLTTVITMSIVGGPAFVLAAAVFAFLFYITGRVYSQTSRDLRRLDSVTRSPLYTIYGETIAGVAVIRAFGASSKFLRDMLRFMDTNTSPFFWMFGVNRWLSCRFSLLTSAVLGTTALVSVLTPSIDASLAGFALTLASSLLIDMISMTHRYVALEQSLVAVERVKEFSDLPRESFDYIEPRPPANWPSEGAIQCENLVIRYAPGLPNVLHNLTFEIKPGEKVGILGRTGSGKSTLALSFFRFIEPTEGRILVDGLDIAKVGLTDLRSRLTIIPQDPTILSGTLRSTLDVINEYEDAEIYEALRRVHLIPSEDDAEEIPDINANVFRNLDSPVSEGGENFSTGEKQLLCMARAILKRSKVLVMDEATASVDYATDELIGKTIRQGFAHSTILTIAHRLRTIIDYDKVMLLDQGRIVEFDKPTVLLSDLNSRFYALCKATGAQEFSTLKKLAGV